MWAYIGIAVVVVAFILLWVADPRTGPTHSDG